MDLGEKRREGYIAREKGDEIGGRREERGEEGSENGGR